jgi:redox-sensitive bicupin YhaK (pirin superfamily)
MFPLLDPDGPNPVELFQIWLNLPRADKMVEPYFTMMWDHEIPRVVTTDAAGRTATVTVIAGQLEGVVPLTPPPNSWAARPEADLAIWHVELEPGASLTMPVATEADTVRVVYVFEGEQLSIGSTVVGADTGNVVRADVAVSLTAGAEPVEALVLQARPIGEPVVQHGPFVMNDRAGIEQAFADYQRTQFGGWPWPKADPVHPRRTGRFARHADGRVDEVGTITGR